MFEITQAPNNSNWCIIERLGYKGSDYLHSNGRVFRNCAEYFPTKEIAQEVLDKFQPPHKWRHGDVFEFEVIENGLRCDAGTMIYIEPFFDADAPYVLYIDRSCDTFSSLAYYLKNAKFLFNIKEKI